MDELYDGFIEKTDYLTETKGLLKDRINSLGGSITSGTTFRDYLVWLDSLYEALDEKTITGLPDSLEGKCEQTGTPTPSSPQPINITTGRQEVFTAQKNLADVSKTLIGYAWNWGTNSARAVLYIPAKENTSYTFSFSGTNTMTSMGIFFKTNKSDTSVLGGNIYDFTGTRTLTSPTNTNWIGIQFNKTAITIDDITPLKLMVSTSSDTTYEEYKGNDYEINLGKNLFNANDTYYARYLSSNLITIENNNIIFENTATGTNGFVWWNIPIQLKQLTISYGDLVETTISNSNRVQYLFSDTPITSYSSDIVNGTPIDKTNKYATITPTKQYLVLILRTNASANYIISNLQVEYGNATSYSPYKTPIYLGKIGTYQDYIFKNTTENPLYDENLEEGQWYIHKEIGRVVLNGSEDNWNSSTANYYLPINDIKLGSTCYSNYFVNSTTLGTFGYFRVPTTQHWLIFMSVSSQYTYQQWKTWLSTHNVEVCYVLNTPTDTLIEDEELINQLNEIEIFTVISEDFYN